LLVACNGYLIQYYIGLRCLTKCMHLIYNTVSLK